MARSHHAHVILSLKVQKAQFPSALAHLRAIIATIVLSRLSTSQLLMITKEVVSVIKEAMISAGKSLAIGADSSLFNLFNHSRQLIM